MKSVSLLLIAFLLLGCKNDSNKQPEDAITGKEVPLKYAKGFSVEDYKTHIILNINKPWPKAEKSYTYVIYKEAAIIDWKDDQRFDHEFSKPITKLVTTSTTHIPALELLGVEQYLIGFPGTDYISSVKTRKRIDNGEIRELGVNESINTEVLLELQPDVVIGFGVDGVNKTFETIKKAGTPVIYNGDWVESSALAKAEWIKFFGVLFNKQKEADSIFNQIEKDYIKAKALAKEATSQPTVMSGAMHKDVWYLPNGSSPEAQFLADAHANYLWKDTSGNGSLALGFESVFEKAKDADLWISPSYYTSYEQLQNANSLYKGFKAFKNKTIYTFSNTVGATGGVLYYELGVARPDLVLKDLIKVSHPELLEGYEPYFFKPLND